MCPAHSLQETVRLAPCAEIGIGLTGAGLLFMLLGMMMFFDKGLLAFGSNTMRLTLSTECDEKGGILGYKLRHHLRRVYRLLLTTFVAVQVFDPQVLQGLQGFFRYPELQGTSRFPGVPQGSRVP